MALATVLDENIYNITLEIAQGHMDKCMGSGVIDLKTITPGNMSSLRFKFMEGAMYDTDDLHESVIVVLVYMSYFIIEV